MMKTVQTSQDEEQRLVEVIMIAVNECVEKGSCLLTSPYLPSLWEKAGQGISVPAAGGDGGRSSFCN